jgi:hypothetical protein
MNWTVVDFALSTFVAKDSTSINILHRAFFYIPERLAHVTNYWFRPPLTGSRRLAIGAD